MGSTAMATANRTAANGRRDRRPRVVLIQPQCFAHRDLQYYVPLLEEFDIRAITFRLRADQRRAYGDIPEIPLLSADQIVGAAPPFQRALDRLLRLRSENLYYFWGLERALAGADLVVCLETFHPYCLQAARLQARLGYRLAFSVYENIAFAHENLAIRRKIKRAAFDQGDVFLTLSEQGKNTLLLEGAPDPARVHVVGMGLDTGLYHPGAPDPDALAALGVPPGDGSDLTLLYAGRLVWEKGIYEAVEAAGLLQRSDLSRRYQLLIAGDGPEAGELRARVERMGLADRVRFLGRVTSRQQMVALYRRADLCLVPSIPTRKWQEQFGAVLTEAMACGCPVVTTHTGAIPEVVGDAAVLVAPSQHTELAEAIRRLAARLEERRDLSERGRRRAVERYDNRVVAERIRTAFRSALPEAA